MQLPSSLIAENESKSRHPGITARVIADSSADYFDSRLTTVEVTFPMFIQSELNTYRAFSRNSASSRAIPVKTQIEAVKLRPFVPHRIYAAAKGMHSTELLDPSLTLLFQEKYRQLSIDAANNAATLFDIGAHKQHVGRILMPYAWQTVLITATEWENFFLQRLAVDAQPEINDLAWAIYQAMSESIPRSLNEGEWHLPYAPGNLYSLDDSIIVSVANCARVSYTKHGTDSTLESCRALVDRLTASRHMSPFEHVAQYIPRNEHKRSNFAWCWLQYRTIVENR